MDTSNNTTPDPVTAATSTAENTAQEGRAAINDVANGLETTAEKASEAAQHAATQGEHEVMSGVASALNLLHAELKRANDQREFEQRKADEALQSAETTEQPVAQVVEDGPPARFVRRGGRKVKR